MAKNISGAVSQELKEDPPLVHRKLLFNLNPEIVSVASPRTSKANINSEAGKFQAYHEEFKRNSVGVNGESNLKRLRALKPDINSLVTRFLTQKTEDEPVQIEKPYGLSLENRKGGNILGLNDFTPSGNKNKQPLKSMGASPPISILPKYLDKDKEHIFHETEDGITSIPVPRDTQQNSMNGSNPPEEILLGKKKGPTMKVLKAFYPKAKAFVRKNKEENADNSRSERDAVEDLDRWDNNHKQSFSNQQFTNEELQQRQFQWKPQQEKTIEPRMNSGVINMIAKELVEAEESEPDEISQNIPKPKGPTKTTEIIRQLTNQKVLNMVVFNKTKSMVMKLDDHVLTEKTGAISGDTISNFKNLQENLGPLTFGGLIDYDSLLERLYNIKYPLTHLFDFTLEKREKEDEELTLKFSLQEKNLLQKFQETIVEVHERKDIQSGIRIENHNLTTKIKSLRDQSADQNEQMERDLVSYEEKIKKSRQTNTISSNKYGRRKAKEVIPSSLHIEDYRRLEKKREEINSNIKQNDKEIRSLQQEHKKHSERLEDLDNQIKELKLLKFDIRLELKNLYIKMLKNERQLILSYTEREDTLIYLIKQLWKINEEVTEDLFPKFLDKNLLKFLFKYAQLDYEREQIEHYKISEEYKMFMQLQDSKNEHAARKKSLNLIQNPVHVALREVKVRIDKLKKGLTKRKRPIFSTNVGAGGKATILRWEDMSELEPSMQGNFAHEIFNFNQQVDVMLEEIKKNMIKLREEEANKLFEQNTTKAIDEKFLRNLSKILICLFGRSEAEKFFMKFVHIKQNHEIKTSQNKTFTLDSNKANNSIKMRSQSSVGLMMSYSSAFRNIQPEIEKLSGKGSKPSDSSSLIGPKTERTLPPQWNITKENIESQETNYLYNSIYNYFPNLQNSNESSSYFVNQQKKGSNRPAFTSTSKDNSQGDRQLLSSQKDRETLSSRGGLSSQGADLMLTQQTGTTSTRGFSGYGNRGFSSQGLRGVSSQGNRLMSAQSSLSTARRVTTEGSVDKNIKTLKKVKINDIPFEDV